SDHGWFAEGVLRLQRYWTANRSLFFAPTAVSDTATRGGPLLRTPSNWSGDFSVGSDDRKKFFFNVSTHYDRSSDSSYRHSFGVGLNARPSSNVQLSLTLTIRCSHDH